VGAAGCDVGVVKGVVVFQGAVCGVWSAEPVLRQAMGRPAQVPAASPKDSGWCETAATAFSRGPENSSLADVHQSTLLLPMNSALTARCVAAALLPLYLEDLWHTVAARTAREHRLGEIAPSH